MSKINITHSFTIHESEVIDQLNDFIETLERRYQLKCQWDSGTCLSFDRPGATGKVVILKSELVFTMQLGFLFSMFKHRIENDILNYLNENVL